MATLVLIGMMTIHHHVETMTLRYSFLLNNAAIVEEAAQRLSQRLKILASMISRLLIDMAILVNGIPVTLQDVEIMMTPILWQATNAVLAEEAAQGIMIVILKKLLRQKNVLMIILLEIQMETRAQDGMITIHLVVEIMTTCCLLPLKDAAFAEEAVRRELIVETPKLMMALVSTMI